MQKGTLVAMMAAETNSTWQKQVSFFKLMVYLVQQCIECMNVQEDNCMRAKNITPQTVQLASLG